MDSIFGRPAEHAIQQYCGRTNQNNYYHLDHYQCLHSSSRYLPTVNISTTIIIPPYRSERQPPVIETTKIRDNNIMQEQPSGKHNNIKRGGGGGVFRERQQQLYDRDCNSTGGCARQSDIFWTAAAAAFNTTSDIRSVFMLY